MIPKTKNRPPQVLIHINNNYFKFNSKNIILKIPKEKLSQKKYRICS